MERDYLSAWFKEIYVVVDVIIDASVVYKVKYLAGELLEDTFYLQELQKVEMVPEERYKIENILKNKNEGLTKIC